MSRVEAAAGMDRLPWLEDEPAPQRPKGRRGVVAGSAAAAVLVVAAGGFWLGSRSVHEGALRSPRPQASATLRLPSPRPAQQPEVKMPPQPEVRIASVPEVRPAPAKQVRIAAPPKPAARQVSPPTPADEQASSPAAATPVPVAQAPALQNAVPKPWQPRIVHGAAGRLVEIGAFGSVPQAKLGWRYMVRSYPAMSHLPAVVRPDRNSKGRMFYRFRVGTTSQAHSEVLCQRMLKIHLSCAVVGLPWKAKVER